MDLKTGGTGANTSKRAEKTTSMAETHEHMDCPPHGPYAPDIACKCKQCVDEAAVADTAHQIRNLLDYLHRMSEDVTEEGSGPAAPARQEAPEEHPTAHARPRLIRRRWAPDQEPPAAGTYVPGHVRTHGGAREDANGGGGGMGAASGQCADGTSLPDAATGAQPPRPWRSKGEAVVPLRR